MLLALSPVYAHAAQPPANRESGEADKAEDEDKKHEGKDKNEEKGKKDKDKKDEKDKPKHWKIGNLAMPSSQQPGPLISFGENVLDQGLTQFFIFADDFGGDHKHFIDLQPGILYGITDSFSVFLNLPIALSYRDDDHHSSGLEDVFVEFEYAFYNKEDFFYVDQATLVASISFPSGSAEKVPPTGFDSLGLFVGATYNRTGFDWFYFTSYGANISDWSRHRTKIGNSYDYQAGFGRRIANLPGWLFAWMVEVDGTFSQRNVIDGVKDPNSGGNVIYATPSIWISSEKLIFQLGAGYAVEQHLFGDQRRDQYLLALNIGWTF
jgi:hypothetical protein